MPKLLDSILVSVRSHTKSRGGEWGLYSHLVHFIHCTTNVYLL